MLQLSASCLVLQSVSTSHDPLHTPRCLQVSQQMQRLANITTKVRHIGQDPGPQAARRPKNWQVLKYCENLCKYAWAYHNKFICKNIVKHFKSKYVNAQPRNIEQDCLSCWMNSCFNPQLEEGCSMISRTSLPKQARTRNAQASAAANLWAFTITTKSRHTIVVICFHYRIKPPQDHPVSFIS